jgi:hypothetical protein
MSNRPLIITLGVIAVAYITALSAILTLYDGDKLAVAGILSGALALLIPQMLSLKQSADNAVRIERANDKIDANTETTNTTHQIVNSQRTEMVKRIDELTDIVAALRTERAVKQSEEEHEDTSEARIVAAIEDAAPHKAKP